MKQEHVFTGIIVVLVVALIGMAWYVGSLKRNNGNAAMVYPGQQNNDQTNPATNGDQISFRPIDNTDYVRGASKPKFYIVEYSDTECPYCIKFHQTLKQVLQSYPNDIAWVYRFSPIPALHQYATSEAVAAHCVGKINGSIDFWRYLDRIFDTTQGNDSLDQIKLDEYAAELGVNSSSFATCRQSADSLKRVSDDIADARRAGLQGTPYSLILNTKGEVVGTIPGYVTYAQLQPKIDALLKAAN